MGPRTIRRVLAGAAGVGVAALALQGSALVVFVALLAEPPDAFAPEEDPCCPPPESWGELAVGVGFVLVAAVVAGLLWCGALALLGWALHARRPPWRRLALAPAGALLVAVAVTAVQLAPGILDARTRRDCDELRVTPGSLRAADGVEAQEAVARCGLVDGATRAEVRARLGPPGIVDGPWWHYGRLWLAFERGRVVSADFDL